MTSGTVSASGGKRVRGVFWSIRKYGDLHMGLQAYKMAYFKLGKN
jgi:hypothetical protein